MVYTLHLDDKGNLQHKCTSTKVMDPEKQTEASLKIKKDLADTKEQAKVILEQKSTIYVGPKIDSTVTIVIEGAKEKVLGDVVKSMVYAGGGRPSEVNIKGMDTYNHSGKLFGAHMMKDVMVETNNSEGVVTVTVTNSMKLASTIIATTEYCVYNNEDVKKMIKEAKFEKVEYELQMPAKMQATPTQVEKTARMMLMETIHREGTITEVEHGEASMKADKDTVRYKVHVLTEKDNTLRDRVQVKCTVTRNGKSFHAVIMTEKGYDYEKKATDRSAAIPQSWPAYGETQKRCKMEEDEATGEEETSDSEEESSDSEEESSDSEEEMGNGEGDDEKKGSNESGNKTEKKVAQLTVEVANTNLDEQEAGTDSERTPTNTPANTSGIEKVQEATTKTITKSTPHLEMAEKEPVEALSTIPNKRGMTEEEGGDMEVEEESETNQKATPSTTNKKRGAEAITASGSGTKKRVNNTMTEKRTQPRQ